VGAVCEPLWWALRLRRGANCGRAVAERPAGLTRVRERAGADDEVGRVRDHWLEFFAQGSMKSLDQLIGC